MIAKMTTSRFRKAVIKPAWPILLEFYTDWCPTCRGVNPILDRLRIEFRNSASIFRVDADAEWELVREFGIQGVPTFVVLRNGHVQATLVGPQKFEKLRRELIRARGASATRGAPPRIA